jgi:hypothetical protein
MHNLEVGPYKFEAIHSFTYLGSKVNCINDISEEIQKIILAANRCFHGLREHLRSHLISKKNTKISIYKVLIRPVLTYASETWTLSKINERRLGLFERRVLRCIFGAKQENGTWPKRYNYDLYEIFKDSDIFVYIKAKRLAWAGHLTRMSDERTLKKIFSTKPDETRSVGRPKLRWEDGIALDMQILGVKRWKKVALNRDEWAKLLKKTRVHQGLSSQ